MSDSRRASALFRARRALPAEPLPHRRDSFSLRRKLPGSVGLVGLEELVSRESLARSRALRDASRTRACGVSLRVDGQTEAETELRVVLEQRVRPGRPATVRVH